MSHSNVQIVFYSTDPDEIAGLKPLLQHQTDIKAVTGTGPQVAQSQRLDALWLAPMQATYFGLTESVAPGKAKVFPMPQQKRDLGFPRFAVVGVNLIPNKEYSAEALLKLLPASLCNAVAAWNTTSSSKISRIGSLPGTLLNMDRPGPSLRALWDCLGCLEKEVQLASQVQKVSA